jgi:hypothetical protein
MDSTVDLTELRDEIECVSFCRPILEIDDRGANGVAKDGTRWIEAVRDVLE